MTRQPKNRTVRREARIRAKIQGTADRPRLSVYRSNVAIYAQLIDDANHKTLMGITEKEVETKEKMTKSEKAKAVGSALAKKAKEKKITAVVFDKGSYAYHGRVKALADGAREGGLVF